MTAPSFPRLTLVELRKMVDTRAGFWLQVTAALLTLVVVTLFCVFAEIEDLVFREALALAILPASILLPIIGILLVSSEWSQTMGIGVFARIALLCVIAIVTGIAFGAAFLSSAPAIVLYFALPIAWAALGSIPFLNDVAEWLDTTRTTAPMTERLLTGEEWAQLGTSLALWVALPLAIGLYRIARGEIRAA